VLVDRRRATHRSNTRNTRQEACNQRWNDSAAHVLSISDPHEVENSRRANRANEVVSLPTT
jgi:hypothetical protein